MEEKTSSNSIFSNSSKWNLGNDTLNMEDAPKNISILAILALVCACLSCLLFTSIYFYFLPVISLLLVIISLFQIAHSRGELIGRSMAFWALWILLIPSIAVPIMDYCYRQRMIQDAKSYFNNWFEIAKKGEFRRIRVMQNAPHIALITDSDESYWSNLVHEPETHTTLHEFLTNEFLLTLATLGDKVKTSYYKTNLIVLTPDREDIQMIYAITCPGKDGGKETFYALMNAFRYRDDKHNIAIWKGGDNIKAPLPIDKDGLPIVEAEQ